MSPAEARDLLEEYAPPGAPWAAHCRQVARVARLLADELAGRGAPVAPEELEVQGLLHDIGRARTHGPYHGWAGYVLLRARGRPEAGRGCLTHWLKGRSREELAAHGAFRPRFLDRVLAALDPPDWTVADSVLSVADASVRHSTVVDLDERFRDLSDRYGDSRWLRRARELTEQHARDLGRILGRPVAELLRPLYGDSLA
ncbi:MAG: HD domain-containing protein [Planctomycetota bacterium]|nr:MAG: HD domain-containing protein [Planctomycetota bacterium]